jgi:hypothetical protein
MEDAWVQVGQAQVLLLLLCDRPEGQAWPWLLHMKGVAAWLLQLRTEGVGAWLLLACSWVVGVVMQLLHMGEEWPWLLLLHMMVVQGLPDKMDS